MGNGMRKYSQCDGYYKKRRKTNDGGANFTKDYCEYWKSEKKGGKDDNFAIERNEFSFSNNSAYDSPLRNSRKPPTTTFISSFDNSNNFSKNIGRR
ncbi:unnamed protein product [Caenorhabditis sp. 36 PRJEB53466]|nr:unnamed protein product [Caenorhabditis sp. 36 PRJEB53466]